MNVVSASGAVMAPGKPIKWPFFEKWLSASFCFQFSTNSAVNVMKESSNNAKRSKQCNEPPLKLLSKSQGTETRRIRALVHQAVKQ